MNEHMNNKQDDENTLKVHNTITKNIEAFRPLSEEFVGIFNCGPTIHRNHTQIGNLRSYIFSDLVKRYLRYLGYTVRHVTKVTDVDNHTIAESQEHNIPIGEYTAPLYKDYIKQLQTVNIILPDYIPRVTEHIPELVSTILTLKEKGYTYTSNESTYFRVANIVNYGELASLEKQKALKANAQKRMEDFHIDEKESVNDFCLWKHWEIQDGPVFWETSIGKGRPGWHLECSVLSRKYLGDSFDIHIGGISHIFPHHTNEIAISEAITGKKFVKYWLHHDYLIVDGEKMSKQKETFYTLKTIVDHNYHPLVLRFMLLTTHYRKKLNFTWQGLNEAEVTVMKFLTCLLWLDSITHLEETSRNTSEEFLLEEEIASCRKSFKRGMNNDFNISESILAMHNFVNSLHKNEKHLTARMARQAFEFLLEVDEVIGVLDKGYKEYTAEVKETIKKNEAQQLIEERRMARNRGDFALSDTINKRLFAMGLQITDCKKGNSYIKLAVWKHNQN